MIYEVNVELVSQRKQIALETVRVEADSGDMAAALAARKFEGKAPRIAIKGVSPAAEQPKRARKG